MKTLFFALLLLLPLPASAQHCKFMECLSYVTADATYPTIAMHEMKGGRWVLDLAPMYWQATIPKSNMPLEDVDLKGYGVSIALKRELTPHWGLGVQTSIARQSGESAELTKTSELAPPAANAGVPGGAGFAGGKFGSNASDVVLLMATYDPFSDPDGFRMPISFGPAYVRQELKFHHAFTNPNNGRAQVETYDMADSFMGAFVNLSFDVMVGNKFRVMPGVFAAGALDGNGFDTTDFRFKTPKPTYDYVVKQNGTTYRFPHEVSSASHMESVYISFLYRPWNLTLNWSIFSTDSSSYGFQWTRRW